MDNNELVYSVLTQKEGARIGKSISSTVYTQRQHRESNSVLTRGEFMDKLFVILEQLAEGRREVIRCKEKRTKIILITAEDTSGIWCQIDEKGISLGHAGKLTDDEIYKKNRTGPKKEKIAPAL